MKFNSFVITFLILLLLPFLSLAQKTRQSVKNFIQKEYGDSCAAQNWSVVQGKNGVLYFGNAYRVLQYDGVYWNSIRTPLQGGYIISMAVGDDGTTYIGANGEFGFLKTAENGSLEYNTLLNQVPEEDLFFSIIWRTFNYDGGIIFFSQEKIFYWKNKKLSVINPKTSFHLAFIANKELYVRQRGFGLMKYQDGKLTLVPGGDRFKDYGVFGIYPTNDKDRYLITTQELGLFNYYINKSDSAILPLETPDHDLLVNAQIIGGIRLSDGNIALNTTGHGVLIISDHGRLLNIIDQNTGIRDNDIKQIYQANDDNLWLAMNNGICKVNYSSPVSFYDNTAGLFGRIHVVEKCNNQLYVGTSSGIYKKNYSTEKLYKHFIQIENFNNDVRTMKAVNNELFIGTKNGLFLLDPHERILKLNEFDASAVYWSDKKKLLFVAGNNGLGIYYKGVEWKLLKWDEGLFALNVLNIAEDKSANNNITKLWIGTLGDGAIKAEIKNDLSIKYDYFSGNKDGLEDTWIRPFNYKKTVLFSVMSGLMHFIDEETIKKSLPDSLQNTNVELRGYFDSFELFNIDSASITSLIYDQNITYLCIDGKLAIINEKNELTTEPFLSIDKGNINALLPDRNYLWAGADESLVLIDLMQKKNYSKKPNIRISKVLCDNDSILFHGNANKNSKSTISIIDYKQNLLTFFYASLFEENGYLAEYSVKLEGYQNEWSKWTNEPKTTYTNLREGVYTFSVKARDIYNNESIISNYGFEILPPWYRTTWAFISYLILAVLLIYVIVKLSMVRLKKKNEQLEQLVAERTVEIRQQKDEIENQRDVLAEQKQEIEDSINYAKRIQNAVLPHAEYTDNLINEYFVLFKPKDIVSGDFYWFTKIDNRIIITAADCTGHGVPGAFMSMLGVSFLNEIVRKEEITEAHLVLNELRSYIIEALQQKGLAGEQKDGMDLALISWDMNNDYIEYAGANNPLYLIRNNELIEFKADKMPIGIHYKTESFKTTKIPIQGGDCIYMFSDGYADQFGGPKGKKLKYKPFKDILLENHSQPMSMQKNVLDEKIEEWKAFTNPFTGNVFEQIDDIVIIGMRF